MNFSVEEENLICMYHTSDRRRTMARMLAALPDMDTEMRRLANGTIAKLEHMTDADFDGQRFNFAGESYRYLDNSTLFSTKVMCHCHNRNSRTRWPCGCCVRLFFCQSLSDKANDIPVYRNVFFFFQCFYIVVKTRRYALNYAGLLRREISLL